MCANVQQDGLAVTVAVHSVCSDLLWKMWGEATMNVVFVFSLSATTTCNPNPCVHGTCYPINLPIGLTVFCSCDNQWTGKWCDVDMDGEYRDISIISLSTRSTV